jgi:acyl carrier protein
MSLREETTIVEAAKRGAAFATQEAPVTLGNREEVLNRLVDYVRRELLGNREEDGASELTPDSPLLEWGVLNSMNTTRLLTFLREELDVTVPPTHITGRYFRDLNSVTDLVLSLPRS